MDLCYQRYASPFSFLDLTISQGRFAKAVSLIDEKVAEEKEWDYYIHRVKTEISFADFRKSIHPDEQENKEIDLEAAISQSKNILNGFNPYVEE